MQKVTSLGAWRALGWGMLLAFCTGLLAGCSSGTQAPSQKRIVVLMNGNSPFWDAVGVGIREGAKELGLEEAGYEATLETNDATPQGQINKLRQFASQSDIVAVGISATDAANAAIIDEMKKLRDKGVHVITIDSDVDASRFRDARYAFVGTDSFVAGKELGIATQHLRPDGGEFVTFVGRTTAQNAIDRVGGVVAGAGEKFKHLDNMGDQNDRSKSRQNVRDAIANHPGLNALVGIWSYNAPAIVDVVREQPDKDKFVVTAFDAEPLAVQYMADGDIDAMVVQNPYQMGYQGIRLLKALVEKDQATLDEMFPNYAAENGDFLNTGVKMVVPDEGSPLKREMFLESTEFLPLSEFKAWLKKYNLEGS
jgi:ribose transport system substrate-binding protein